MGGTFLSKPQKEPLPLHRALKRLPHYLPEETVLWAEFPPCSKHAMISTMALYRFSFRGWAAYTTLCDVVQPTCVPTIMARKLWVEGNVRATATARNAKLTGRHV